MCASRSRQQSRCESSRPKKGGGERKALLDTRRRVLACPAGVGVLASQFCKSAAIQCGARVPGADPLLACTPFIPSSPPSLRSSHAPGNMQALHVPLPLHRLHRPSRSPLRRPALSTRLHPSKRGMLRHPLPRRAWRLAELPIDRGGWVAAGAGRERIIYDSDLAPKGAPPLPPVAAHPSCKTTNTGDDDVQAPPPACCGAVSWGQPPRFPTGCTPGSRFGGGAAAATEPAAASACASCTACSTAAAFPMHLHEQPTSLLSEGVTRGACAVCLGCHGGRTVPNPDQKPASGFSPRSPPLTCLLGHHHQPFHPRTSSLSLVASRSCTCAGQHTRTLAPCPGLQCPRPVRKSAARPRVAAWIGSFLCRVNLPRTPPPSAFPWNHQEHVCTSSACMHACSALHACMHPARTHTRMRTSAPLPRPCWPPRGHWARLSKGGAEQTVHP